MFGLSAAAGEQCALGPLKGGAEYVTQQRQLRSERSTRPDGLHDIRNKSSQEKHVRLELIAIGVLPTSDHNWFARTGAMANLFELSTGEAAKKEADAEAHRQELIAIFELARFRLLTSGEARRANHLIDLIYEYRTEQRTTTH